MEEQSNVQIFTEPLKDKCPKSPNGEHDWSGPTYDRGSEGGTTCIYCGMEFGEFAMWCLP